MQNSPREVGVNPLTNHIYVSHVSSSSVSVIDGATNQVVDTVTVGVGPRGVGVNPSINRIYVANSDSFRVSVIDGLTNQLITHVLVGDEPVGLGVNPVTNLIYALNTRSDNVTVIQDDTEGSLTPTPALTPTQTLIPITTETTIPTPIVTSTPTTSCKKPVAEFKSDKLTILENNPVQFTDLSNNEPTSWIWDFGDGAVKSDVQNPTYIYTTEGKFNVSLTVSNSCGVDSEEKIKYIDVVASNEVPQALFSASPTSGIEPLTVIFKDKSSGSPSTWIWDFGDNDTSGEQNPVHEYKTANEYTVSLSVSNEKGVDTLVQVNLISVEGKNPPLQTPFPFPTSTPFIPVQTPFPFPTSTPVIPVPTSTPELCIVPSADFIASSVQGKIPLTVNFTDISEGNPTEWLWDFGDGGMSISKNPAHKYELIGQYTVSLNVSNECGDSEEVKTDFINALPIKSFTFKCGKEFIIGAKELETLVMEIGLNEQCKLKLTNLEPGVLVDVDTLIRSGFRSSIIAHPLRSTTNADGELEITITAVKKGIDWVAWAVRNEDGEFEYSKNAYDAGTAWGMFVEVK